MTKRKAILTSVLIMVPTGGILIALIQHSIWNSLPFIGALAVYGFIQLWMSVIRWLETPDNNSNFHIRFGGRKNRKEAC